MDIVQERVIARLPHKEAALQLTRHARNRLVKNTNGAYYYEKPNGTYQVLSGLLPRLRSVFWPESDFHAARSKKQIKTQPQKGPVNGRHEPLPKAPRHGRGRFYGSIRGTEVHRQLKDFVELDGKNYVKRHHGKINEFTKRILLYLLERRLWVPLACEFDIFDEQLGIGTSVDMICVDREGQLILLEFKTGYRDYFDSAQGRMLHSLSDLSCTPRHQAHVQLIAAAIILVEQHGLLLEQMRLYVMRVDEDDLEVDLVSNAYVAEKMQALRQDLLLAAPKK